MSWHVKPAKGHSPDSDIPRRGKTLTLTADDYRMSAMENTLAAGTLAAEADSASRRKVDFKGGRLIERTTVIDSVVAEIRAKIASGELRDGDTLPSQDEMAQALGVSRASLREALNRLALMGLVEMKHGRGTYVRTARPQDLMNSLSSLLILDRPSAAELLEARFHVESALAALAAMNASDEELGHIHDLMLRMEREEECLSVEGFVLYDTQLHMLFATSARNPVLKKVMDILWDVLPQRIRHIASTEQIPVFLGFHRAIYAAIARHDPAAARQEMERHVQYLINLNAQSSASDVRSLRPRRRANE